MGVPPTSSSRAIARLGRARYSWVAVGAELERFVRALRRAEAPELLPGAPAEAR